MLFRSLNVGEADIHVGLFESPERAKWLDFGDPIYQAQTAIFFKSDDTPVPLREMKGKRVGVVKGWLQEGYLKREYPDVTAVTVPGVDELIVGLLKGDMDAVLCETLILDAVLDSLGLRGALVRHSEIISSLPQYPGITKGKPQLLKKINEGLALLSENEFSMIEDRWIPDPENRIYSTVASSHGIKLTIQEKVWIQKHPTITIAATPDWPPFESRDADGHYVGISADFIRMAARRVGIKLAFHFDRWGTLVEHLKNKKLDLSPGLVQSKERDKFLLFGKTFTESNDVLMVLKSRDDIKSFADLKGKTVVVEKGFFNEEFLRTEHPEIKRIIVPSTYDALKAVVSEKADAYIGMQAVVSYIMDKQFLTNLKVAFYVEGHDTRLRLGVRNDYGVLRDILNKAYASITPRERNAIISKYLHVEPQVNLTPQETAWLKAHPVIRIANEMDWPPYSFVENGKAVGFSTDYIKLIADKVGLKIEWETGHSWNDILKLAQDEKVDVIHSLGKTAERKEYLNFTSSFHTSSKVMITRPEDSSISSLEEMADKRVAVVKGFNMEEELKNVPQMERVEVASTHDGLIAVSMGKADVFIDRQPVCQYYIKKYSISNLAFAAVLNDAGSNGLCIGIRKSWPELALIFEKGMEAISKEEMAELEEKWFGAPKSVIPPGSKRKKVVLTADEKQWIADHKDIRLGVDPSWPPFEYFQGVTYSGLSAEHIKQLAKDTGLSFATPPILNWTEVIRLAKEQKMDVLPGVTRTPEREKHLSFSKSYGKFPIAIYQRTNDIPVTGMDDLDGKSVAVVSGYAIEEFLNDNHSDILVEPFRTLDKALMALSTDRVDALAGNIVAVEHSKQTHSLFNVVPTIKTPYVQELHFGVREDWGTLVRILDKWLATIDTATKERMARDAGVNLDTEFVAEAVEKSIDFTQLLFIGGAIILVFGAALIILLFLRRFIGSRAETLYSSHQYKTVGIVVGILFLCLVVVATWLALARVETKARESMGDVLESILLTTHEALAIWERQNKLNIIELTENPVLRGLTGSLLSLPEDAAIIESSPQLWNIRKFMDKMQATRGFVDYSIVSEDFLNYATPDNPDLLDKNIISIQRPRVLDKAMLGSTIFVPPTTFESDHEGDHGKGDMSLVSIASPINGHDGKVLAVLILYYNAADDYQRIIALGRLGKTGETYAFDKNGSLMSTNRFDDMVHSLGLIEENQKAIINLRVADPGGNLVEGYALDKDAMLPLTVSVKSATARKTGRNLEGYRDYRGVPVYGAWLWDDELGLGLVTEIDVDEALGSFRLVRNTVIAVIFITILLGSLMTGLSNWIGQSAAKSLLKSKEELEDRVEERTAELKKISVAVEQSPAMVLITDTEGTIEYVNPKFIQTTGYTQEEVVGNNPRILKSGKHTNEFYKDLWTTILIGESWSGDLLNKKKDGVFFWVRNAIAPLFNDEGELTHFVAVMEDITDRKAQEERFQALLDAAPDAMVIVAQDGEITLVNIATEELFGYSREEIVGNKVEMLLPDYIRKKHPQYRDKIFANPGDMSVLAGKEFYGQTKDYDQIPVDISLNPIETEDGIQIIASIRDITERKKAEVAIAESEERTRLILSSAGEGIFGVDLSGNVVFINDAACRMVGFAADELMGKGVHEIIHHTRANGDFYPVEECPMRRAFIEGLSSRIDDEVLWRKDGTSFPVEYSAMPVNRGDEMIGAVISFQDVTERREAEEALRKSEEGLKNILTTAAEGFWQVDNNAVTQDVNDAMCTIMGRTKEEAIGVSMFEFLDDENITIVMNQLKLRKKGESGSYDLTISRPDGSKVSTILSAAPLFDSEGVKIGSFAMVSDITDRKKSELEVIRSKGIAEDALSVVTSSIQYASRIQRSVLPPGVRIDDLTVDHFVVWEPRDVVGGDLYWCELWGEGSVIILGDCTGHGVPGAFMTLLATGALKRALSRVPEGDAAGVVSAMHQSIQKQLGQHTDNQSDTASDDGLELGVCYLPPDSNSITYAGARMPLFVDRGDSIEVVKGDKKGIAYRGIPHDFEYTNKTIPIDNGINFIMTTDGIIDQIGGEKGRGFGKKRFIALLESLRDTPLQNQGEKIYSELQTYQGKEKRRDDVSIIGFKL